MHLTFLHVLALLQVHLVRSARRQERAAKDEKSCCAMAPRFFACTKICVQLFISCYLHLQRGTSSDGHNAIDLWWLCDQERQAVVVSGLISRWTGLVQLPWSSAFSKPSREKPSQKNALATDLGLHIQTSGQEELTLFCWSMCNITAFSHALTELSSMHPSSFFRLRPQGTVLYKT